MKDIESKIYPGSVQIDGEYFMDMEEEFEVEDSDSPEK